MADLQSRASCNFADVMKSHEILRQVPKFMNMLLKLNQIHDPLI